MNDVESHTVFDKEDELIQFQDVSHILVTSNKPVVHDLDRDVPFKEIPDLYPVKHTVTLPPEHFYNETSKYRKLTTIRTNFGPFKVFSTPNGSSFW